MKWNDESQIVLIYFGGAAHKPSDWNDFGQRFAALEKEWKMTDDRKKPAEARDYWGKPIKVGDRVSCSIFLGTVRDIRGSQVLVYWDGTSLGDVPDEEAAEIFLVMGIRWKEEQWMEAEELFVEEGLM